MTSKDLRQRIDEALAGLEGDTAPVRALCFDLGRRLNHADQERAALTHDLLAESTHSATLAERVKVLEDQAAAARERLTRQSAQLAALEGEITALKAAPTVSRVAARRGLRALLDDPDRGVEELRRRAAALGRRLLQAVGLEGPGGGLPDHVLYTLLNLGFSEYHLFSTLAGDPRPFGFVLVEDE
jgi:hypothetical protein